MYIYCTAREDNSVMAGQASSLVVQLYACYTQRRDSRRDPMTSNISYGRSEDAWDGYERYITERIQRHNIRRVCEIGGGANPLLNPDFIAQHGISYSILDISEMELDKAPADYDKIIADIAARDFALDKKFDLVFSRMLAEHIPNAEWFHRNVYGMLTSEGLAIHFFPTLYTLPFLVNRMVPEHVADTLLRIFVPDRDRYRYAKFPAYYRWCRGPVPGQIGKFNALGYEVVEYKGFFGHRDYYNSLRILMYLHDIKTQYLLRNPHPFFTSYAYAVLKKA